VALNQGRHTTSFLAKGRVSSDESWKVPGRPLRAAHVGTVERCYIERAGPPEAAIGGVCDLTVLPDRLRPALGLDHTTTQRQRAAAGLTWSRYATRP
jgi:hypothetical protein